jgi:hypothetical protein
MTSSALPRFDDLYYSYKLFPAGETMRRLSFIIFVLCSMCLAQQSTIDIEQYKKSKKHSFSERSYTVGKHTYRVVNIKPLGASDTACISAVVLDKRKYVLFDVNVTSGAFGLIVPSRQPVSGGLVILKASPLDAKVFLVLSSGKMATLPGALVFADTAGSCMYCVWDNDKTFRLTVFDYKNLRLVFNTLAIAEPKQWYTDGFVYGFTAADGAYYTVDFLQKAVVKGEKPASGLAAVSYVADLDRLDRASCCGPAVLK